MQGGEMVLYYSIGVCLIVCLTLIFLAMSIDTPGFLRAKQELLCVEFLASLGYGVTAVEKGTDQWIPLFFTQSYKKLNQLQKEAGFDFTKWRGYRVAVYECTIAGSRGSGICYAVLYLYGEQVIGGFFRDAEGICPLLRRSLTGAEENSGSVL